MSTSWDKQESWFERALFEKHLVGFPPNVSFRGEICRLDGGELTDTELKVLKWIVEPVVSATSEIALPDPARFKVNKQIVSPRTAIKFSGMLNAAARPYGEGELEINLGLLLTFWSLPVTFGLINRLLGEMMVGGSMSLSDLERFKPPQEVIDELDALMGAWDASYRSGWTRAVLPGAALSLTPDHLRMDRGMTFVLTGHELTHWFETIYKDEEWARMMAEMRGHVSTWLAEEKFLRPEIVENARQLLGDPDVLEAWVREVHADCGAFDFFYKTETHGGWNASPQALIRAYVHMAFFFFLLTLLEVYFLATGRKMTLHTHPPAVVRRALFCHVQAKRLRMSQEDFLVRQFGVGTAVGSIMERIIGEYVNVRNGRVG